MNRAASDSLRVGILSVLGRYAVRLADRDGSRGEARYAIFAGQRIGEPLPHAEAQRARYGLIADDILALIAGGRA